MRKFFFYGIYHYSVEYVFMCYSNNAGVVDCHSNMRSCSVRPYVPGRFMMAADFNACAVAWRSAFMRTAIAKVHVIEGSEKLLRK